MLIFFCISIFSSQIKCQEFNYLDFYISTNGDTIFVKDINEVKVVAFKDNIEKRQYHILKKKVIKVYPYAILASNMLLEITDSTDNIKKRRLKKKYIREKVDEIKYEYSSRLKKLTMSEGRILVKLIYRETSETSYDIVKLYRGRFNAFFWQTMAKFWKNDLKTIYDPDNIREDMFIENIIIHENLPEIFK